MTQGDLQTFVTTFSGFAYTIWQPVVFYQYASKGTPMKVAIAAETCRQ